MSLGFKRLRPNGDALPKYYTLNSILFPQGGQGSTHISCIFLLIALSFDVAGWGSKWDGWKGWFAGWSVMYYLGKVMWRSLWGRLWGRGGIQLVLSAEPQWGGGEEMW